MLTSREWDTFNSLLAKIVRAETDWDEKAQEVRKHCNEVNLEEFASWFPDSGKFDEDEDEDEYENDEVDEIVDDDDDYEDEIDDEDNDLPIDAEIDDEDDE